jgi:predicted RNA-binding Zn-ribbon protein involved in translation (DUF1610 family)
MKVACTTSGEQIIANPAAPHQAVCPVCGGALTLRSRKTMNNGQKTYFWRHRSNRNTHCSARNRPMS